MVHPRFITILVAGFGLTLGLLDPAPAPAGDPPGAAAPLPPLNAGVINFARAHLGEPVGDGDCTTLVIAALKAAGVQRRFPIHDPENGYVWGDPVPDLKDVLPGDILQFRDAIFRGTRTVGNTRMNYRDAYPHHTAIVLESAEKGRTITICHQNVIAAGEDPDQRGAVRTAVLRMKSLQKGGAIRAYRPTATRPTPRGADTP